MLRTAAAINQPPVTMVTLYVTITTPVVTIATDHGAADSWQPDKLGLKTTELSTHTDTDTSIMSISIKTQIKIKLLSYKIETEICLLLRVLWAAFFILQCNNRLTVQRPRPQVAVEIK